jgi:diaminohydroxyphosphoribosylaminopyrimidine deaminase/5-amino-6-(5-phosphoribosylamino)uracil reductase
MVISDEFIMQRCFDLALLGNQSTSPNPIVGAVLVHDNTIIGEGYHRAYGFAHAEVNALQSVAPESQNLIPDSTLYVSLEPCCFHGKTPSCTNLIIEKKIPRVVISCLDDTPEVSGKGVAQLRNAGIEVTTGVLEKEGRRLSASRSTFVLEKRPYIILKFAQSRNGLFGTTDNSQFWITNAFSRRLVHKWRSEVDAIMVGTRTAAVDNPQLTNRLYYGPSPLRIVLDRQLQLPPALHLFNGQVPTLVVTEKASPPPSGKNLEYWSVEFGPDLLPALLQELHQRKTGKLLVEGGRRLINSFITANYWDEARVLIGDNHLSQGIPAPVIPAEPAEEYVLCRDWLLLYFSR